MKKSKNNTLIKWFTIFLIIIFLIWAIGSGIVVFTWPVSQNKTQTSK